MSRPSVVNANDAYQLSVNDLAYELSARVFSKYLEIGTRKMVDKEKVAMQEKIDHLNQRINNIRKYYIEKRKNDYVNYQRLKKEATDKIRDAYRKKEVRKSIRKHYKDLYKMINKPTRNKHIPVSLIKPISYIMSQIDLATEPRNYKFVTKNEKYFSDTLSKLSTMLENVDMNKEIDSLDMPKNIVSNLKDFALEVMNFDSVAGMNLNS